MRGVKPIPDRLMTELTAYRTLALRDALAQGSGRGSSRGPARILSQAILPLRVGVLRGSRGEELRLWQSGPRSQRHGDRQSGGRAASPLVRAVAARAGRPLDVLQAFDADSRDALFAHCVAMSINAVYESWNRRPRARSATPIVLPSRRPRPCRGGLVADRRELSWPGHQGTLPASGP